MLLAAGALTLAAGVWCLLAPHPFARFAGFPYSRHFVHDAGAFQVGLGTTLVLAAAWADAAAVSLAGFFVAHALHMLSHIVDLGVGGQGWDAWGLGLISLLTLAALVVRMRQLGGVAGEVRTTAATRRWSRSSARRRSG